MLVLFYDCIKVHPSQQWMICLFIHYITCELGFKEYGEIGHLINLFLLVKILKGNLAFTLIKVLGTPRFHFHGLSFFRTNLTAWVPRARDIILLRLLWFWVGIVGNISSFLLLILVLFVSGLSIGVSFLKFLSRDVEFPSLNWDMFCGSSWSCDLGILEFLFGIKGSNLGISCVLFTICRLLMWFGSQGFRIGFFSYFTFWDYVQFYSNLAPLGFLKKVILRFMVLFLK